MTDNQGYQRFAIELKGNKVVLILTLPDHYTAIELYDQLCESAEAGFVSLDVMTREEVEDDG